MEEDRITLSKYRYENAVEDLEDAELLISNDRFKGALNRCYYAVFHCMLAVEDLDGYSNSKHTGVIKNFNLYYIKTNQFPSYVSKIIARTFELCSHADYKGMFIASHEEAEEQYKHAEIMIKLTGEYLRKRGLNVIIIS